MRPFCPTATSMTFALAMAISASELMVLERCIWCIGVVFFEVLGKV